MGSYLTPLSIVGIILCICVMSLAVWRKVLSTHEDDTLHVSDTGAIPHQLTLAHKLEVIEKWTKIATIVTAIYLICLITLYAYDYWVRSSAIGPM